jgi:hypothetical protein
MVKRRIRKLSSEAGLSRSGRLVSALSLGLIGRGDHKERSADGGTLRVK